MEKGRERRTNQTLSTAFQKDLWKNLKGEKGKWVEFEKFKKIRKEKVWGILSVSGLFTIINLIKAWDLNSTSNSTDGGYVGLVNLFFQPLLLCVDLL